jgi:hypothetical protein
MKIILSLNFFLLAFVNIVIIRLETLLNYSFESLPILNVLIAIILFSLNFKYSIQSLNNRNNFYFYLFILLTFVIISIQIIILNNSFIVLLRYLSAPIIGLLIYVQLKKLKKNYIENILVIILILYILIFLIFYFKFPISADFLCNNLDLKNIIKRGICSSINKNSFFSPEQSYHVLALLFFLIYYEMQNFKKNNFIRVLFIINLLITFNEVNYFYFILYIIFISLDFIKKKLNYVSLIIIILCSLILLKNIVIKNEFEKRDLKIELYSKNTRYVLLEYSLINAKLLPRPIFLNFKKEFTDFLEKNKEFKERSFRNEEVRLNYYFNSNLTLNSYFTYYFHDFGILIFIIAMSLLLKKIIKYKVKKIKILFLFMPYLLINILFQNNFANFYIWILILEINNYNEI